ncbi:hypothetical protein [Plantactinospora endophytica]|uniref:Uncharacterized protein n=1 Tax=Plantactinospora endophytica TaxID=673535 RepID=A0ABQ4EB23_9ACTN|nr:hypothetical protein [Plantactinospora endophytica]GIG91931.1 hypothetical protein Pen02_68670 [Plantactinospora endophytica]
MSVDPTGAPDVPPPPTDPWPTDASVSPGYPPPPQPQDTPSGPATPPPGYPAQPYPLGAEPYPVAGQSYPVSAQPYSGGGQPTGGTGWQAPVPVEPVVAQIGEIAVTPLTVRTPSGVLPLAGSQWHVADYWHSEQKTPTWAIVLAVVGFCVLTVFSLLFLLVKETVHRGTVQVTVTNGARQYVARIPVTAEPQVRQIHQQVNYARSLAAI